MGIKTNFDKGFTEKMSNINKLAKILRSRSRILVRRSWSTLSHKNNLILLLLQLCFVIRAKLSLSWNKINHLTHKYPVSPYENKYLKSLSKPRRQS